jgi:hypothetical protein
MKVYLLGSTRGSWDDWVPFEIGVYTSRELALEAWEKFVELAKGVIEESAKKRPMTEEEYDKLHYFTWSLTQEEEEMVAKYENWLHERPEASKLNLDQYTIEEKILDATDFTMVYRKY